MSVRKKVLATVASVLLNGGFFALLAFTEASQRPVKYDDEAMFVSLVDGQQAFALPPPKTSEAEETPPSENLPGAQSEPKHEPVKQPSPSLVPPAPSSTLKAHTPQPQGYGSVPSGAVQGAAGVPSTSSSGQGQGPVSPAPATQPSRSSGTSAGYAARIRAYLEGFKTYPRIAKRLRQEGVVVISFVINRQGQVLESRILKSSGVAALDQEALDMLKRADPLPRPPDDVQGERIEMTTPVEFSLTP